MHFNKTSHKNQSLSLFYRFFQQKFWSFEKKAVPLHAFSAFGLPSSAAKGTDDTNKRYGNVDDLVTRLTDVTNNKTFK